MTNNWKHQLAELYKNLSKDQKDKKGTAAAKDNLENFRGRKGFNDTGIALTERAVKQQRNNRLSYKKNNYAGSRLNFINDARAEAARQRRLENPDHKKRIDKVLEIADERIAEEKKQQQHAREVDRYRTRASESSNSFFVGRVYTGSNDPGAVEINLDHHRYNSVLERDPVFKNKVEEEIWRLKNKK